MSIDSLQSDDAPEAAVDLQVIAGRVMTTLQDHVETIHGATTVVRNAVAGFPGLEDVLVPLLKDSKHSAVIEKLQLQPQ
jgi:hypothetical protein